VGFTGHIYDSDTGLTDMQARLYDPLIGRFLSTDPVAFNASSPFTFNRYAYANNNPQRNTDPSGTFCLGGWFGTTCTKDKADLEEVVVTAQRVSSSAPLTVPFPLTPPRALPEIIGAGRVLAVGATAGLAALINVALVSSTASDDTILSAEQGTELPEDLTGNNPREGSGRTNTDLPGDSQGVFDRLSGGKSTTQPDGSKVAPNGVRFRPGQDGKGPRIDIPAKGSRSHETIHFPVGT